MKLFSGNDSDKITTFKKYLDKKEINYEVFDGEGNKSYAFAFNQKLDCGPNGRFVVTFNEDRDTVTLYLFNYINFQDESKSIKIHSIINELNASYVFTIFYETENEINMKYSIDIENHFDPEVIMNQLVLMMNVAEKSYPDFMKSIWS